MLKIETIEVTPFMQNARLLWCTETMQGVVVDPGGDADLILKSMKESGANYTEIWLTHSHLDHCGGVSDLQEAQPLILKGHPEEQLLRSKVNEIAAMYGIPKGTFKNSPEPTQFIMGGETLKLGNLEAKVLFTPGHSPGHLCFYFENDKILIAGDTLFAGSIGRTDLPGGNHKQLISSIREEILSLPPQTKVLPGHGPDTTVEVEKASNPFLS